MSFDCMFALFAASSFWVGKIQVFGTQEAWGKVHYAVADIPGP